MSQANKGVVGIFSDPEKLKAVLAKIKSKNLVEFDAFTPFPVHGIEDAMGLKRSPLPWVTFAAGLIGCTVGLGFQIWTSAVDWPLNVGGKPFISVPAFIPVTFELTVLFAGLATAGALFFFCKIPNLDPMILDPNITNDKFAVFVSAKDPKYQEADLTQLLKEAGAHEVRVL